ncbi:hypothetical protein FS764_25790, partial [Agrobacterium vitis]|nr:hypothetical protein [Agrobacterium vitis]
HHPHLFRPLQPRPAPGDPGADRQHGGQHWTPIWGQLSAPIDTDIGRRRAGTSRNQRKLYALRTGAYQSRVPLFRQNLEGRGYRSHRCDRSVEGQPVGRDQRMVDLGADCAP